MPKFFYASCVVLEIVFLASAVFAADSSQFRGPDRSGVFPAEKLLEVWPDSGPQLLHCEIDRIPAVRRTTRIKIYRRLHRAKDFMDSSLDEKIDLPRVAKVACLSPHHFLRLFKELFQETPRQYLIRKRIARDRELLLATERSIGEICSAIGFESLGSFSYLFRRR